MTKEGHRKFRRL